MSDLIYRQAAIDALEAICNRECEYSKAQRSVMCGACHLGSAFDVISQLPSSQQTLVNGSQYLVNGLVNDTISRQAAIDALKEHRIIFCDNTPDTFTGLPYGEKCRVDELDNAIATLINLPSAEPGQRWIPCSERLPEEGDRIILCLNDTAKRKTWFSDGKVYEGIYGSNGFMRVGDNRICEQGDVIAWMPLPKPYEERREDG